MKVSVIGAGSWGTAIAGMLAQNDNEVTLWARNSNLVKKMEETRQNDVYLPGITLDEKVHFTSGLGDACDSAGIIVLAVPSHACRSILEELNKFTSKDIVIVSLVKGLEVGTGMRISQVIRDVMGIGSGGTAVLSGPNHAEEVSLGIPTATVIASENGELACKLQNVFMLPKFRVYMNSDPLGVEIAGAVKNVISIAAGISDGLGFGDNTKASLMTRGLAEIIRLGQALGAKPETFSGLAGIGDLIVTCTSKHSRNRLFGERIGKGEKTQDIVSSMKMVAEGVFTSRAVRTLAGKAGVEMPICQEVYKVIYENKSPLDSVNDLLQRDAAYEH